MRRGLTIGDLGDLVDLPLVAVLATYRADGTVLLSPVRHEYRDGRFNVCTSTGTSKTRHLRNDPGRYSSGAELAPPVPWRGNSRRGPPSSQD